MFITTLLKMPSLLVNHDFLKESLKNGITKHPGQLSLFNILSVLIVHYSVSSIKSSAVFTVVHPQYRKHFTKHILSMGSASPFKQLGSGNKPTNADNNSYVLTTRYHFSPEQQTTHIAFKILFILTKVMVICWVKLQLNCYPVSPKLF